jgi:hypothetical protein
VLIFLCAIFNELKGDCKLILARYDLNPYVIFIIDPHGKKIPITEFDAQSHLVEIRKIGLAELEPGEVGEFSFHFIRKVR